MASDVDICNLALARLGDEANVSSINPPDPSAQANYCAKLYALSLQAVLDDNNWGFATKTATLAAASVNDSSLWPYAYAVPSDLVNIIALFDVNATGDLNYGGSVNAGNGTLYGAGGLSGPAPGNRFAVHGNQQSYSLELDSNGNAILYTDQANALLKYAAYITNTQSFPPSFVDALAWKLASNLAGVIIKGDVGVGAAIKCMQAYQAALANAVNSDTQNRHVFPRPFPSGIAARA
jgi:hypothetical protein